MVRLKTRDEIIHIADRLFYEQGFDSTAFADIATEVGISRGNFYHHFKSKDDILAAVIDLRLARTAAMLETWERNADAPRERIRQFIEILIVNQAKIMQFGCPVGTLCSELAKLDHPFQPQAKEIFDLFRTWLCRQFAAAGCGEGSDRLAMHILMLSQGVAALALAYRDDDFVRSEVADALVWLDQHLPARH